MSEGDILKAHSRTHNNSTFVTLTALTPKGYFADDNSKRLWPNQRGTGVYRLGTRL